ncbi:MAG: 23S rRNA (adenine(2503)-C(2))-methyltransferase RlmN [Armatimonadota bacterium]|nr:23S rRNA (adenine(2503)-C(2))-methyltransferase RlmN [Armatimonadota bacterium]MDW8024536.1 23S rRNA (adenine(2503)-C(2))-methyltransferase RlmN [Armatimonadota bacterium]
MGQLMLVGLTTQELEKLVEQLGEPKFRGRQIAMWVYRKGATDFGAMTNLPKELRRRLSDVALINPLEVIDVKVSSDGTVKYLSRLHDGETVECVFIPHDKWETICVSTQVGCPIGCKFCASGESYARNLTAGEIVGQVLISKRRESPNIVFMGMGEPLLNFGNLVKALQLLNHEVGIGARRITVSTVGIVQGIRKLAQLKMQVNLAVSLHAPNDELRQMLIPTKLPPLSELINACWEYFRATKRRISFEYVLLKGINDSAKHAFELARLLKGMPCHVNLIPYNHAVSNFERPAEETVRRFHHVLIEQGISATIRHERGSDICGACGQLRRHHLTPSMSLRNGRHQ